MTSHAARRTIAAGLSGLLSMAFAPGVSSATSQVVAGHARPPVTHLRATSDASAVELSWRNPSTPGFERVVVRRRLGSTPPKSPTAGTRVRTGSSKATVVVDLGLAPKTRYAYAVFAIDHHHHAPGADIVVKTKRPVHFVVPVSGLAADPRATTVHLTWRNPAGRRFRGVVIRRAAGTDPPYAPSDGTAVAKLGASATSFTDSGVARGQTYSYSLFSYGNGRDSSAAIVTTTTYPSSLEVRNLVVNAAGTPTLSWINPASSDYAGVEIMVTAGDVAHAAPDDPIVMDVPADRSTATIDNLAPGQSYTFTLFAFEDPEGMGPPIAGHGTIPARAGPVAMSGTLPADEVWSPSDATEYDINRLIIPGGITLTIEPGTVVQFATPESSDGVSCLESRGTLTAVGTADNPISFTSPGGYVASIGCDGQPISGQGSGLTGRGVDVEHAVLTKTLVDVEGTISSNHLVDSPVQMSGRAPMLMDNTATDNLAWSTNDLGPPAYRVSSSQIDLNRIAGNTASGSGRLGLALSGQIDTSSILSGGPLPILLEGDNSQVLVVSRYASAVIGPGVIVKALGRAGFTSYGPLYIDGTASKPVVFTSEDDNSVGGNTGSGSPVAGGWSGIEADSRVAFQNADLRYAKTALLAGAASFTVTDSTFATNTTAILLQPDTEYAYGQIHGNWFDGNGMALDGTSMWNGVGDFPLFCHYRADYGTGGNTYGAGQAPTAFVSPSDYSTIQSGVLMGDRVAPPGWTDDIAPGPTDLVAWSTESCQTGSASVDDLATMFDLTYNG